MEKKQTATEVEGFLIEDTRHLSMAQVAENANRTFEGYALPVNHTVDAFAAFCRTHDLDLAQSIVLKDADGAIIGQTMLGIRGRRGWCGGFGIVPAYRGRGFAAMLIGGLVDRARSLGLSVLTLEVLQENAPAVRAYRRAGFEITRELFSFNGALPEEPPAVAGAEIHPLPVVHAIAACATAEADDPTPPVWQRERCMLERKADLRAKLARTSDGEALLLYGYQGATGTLRIERLLFDDPDAARAALRAAVSECEAEQREQPEPKPVKLFVLNEPPGTPLHTLLSDLELPITFRQYEMRLEL